MNTTIAETVLRLYAARIRKIMDLVVVEDPRVRYAEDGEGDAAEPVGEPCDKARANDATFRLRMLPLTHPLLCSALGWLRLDQERLINLHTGIPSLPVCSLAHSLPHLDTCVRVYPLA